MSDFVGISVNELGGLQLLSLMVLATVVLFSLYRYNNRNQLHSTILKTLVYVSYFGVVVALLGFILQPRTKSNITQVVDLYTSGVSENDRRQAIPAYYLTDLAIEARSVSHIRPVFSPQQLLFDYPGLAAINIIGDGLDKEQWQAFANVEVNYQKPKPLNGLIQPFWNRQINLGDYLAVSGRVQYRTNSVLTLQLLDPAKDKITEIKIRQGESFNLRARPKIAGLHSYYLRLTDHEQNELLQEEIAVSVTERKNLKLLIVQSAPSFESKQIQNWAAESGAKILVKSQVSKDKWISRQTNLGLNYTKLSPELYQQFDLMLIDGRALANLSDTQISQIQQSVRAGLGVLVIADQALIKSKAMARMIANIEISSLQEGLEVTPFWSDQNFGLVAPNERFIPAVAGKILAKDKLIRVLVRAENGEPLVVSSPIENGQIALSLLRETHRWVTMNDKSGFSGYWQNLISEVARQAPNQLSVIDKPNKINFAGRANRVCVDSSLVIDKLELNPRLAEAASKKQFVKMNAMPGKLNRYCGVFWPSQSGWYRVEIVQGQLEQPFNSSNLSEWRYFYSPTQWKSVQQAEIIEATLNKQSAYRENEQVGYHKYSETINLWIWWWLFVVSITVLWLERKFS